MQIPAGTAKQGLAERDALYQDLVRRCAVSREDRRVRYGRLRRWYLLGSEGSAPARFNKLQAHVDHLTSHLYGQDTTRFAVKVPARHAAEWAEHAEAARDVFADLWHDSDSDLVFGEALEWACVYGCNPIKLIGAPFLGWHYLHPAQFGVLREDVPDVQEQEAVCHWFSIGLSQLRRNLQGHPRFEELWRRLQTEATTAAGEPAQEGPAPGLGTIVLSQTSPNLVGNVALIAPANAMQAQVDEPTVELAELWAWDDAAADYRCITLGAQGSDVIWERSNPTLKLWLPFLDVVPFPEPGYLWGRSEVERLIPLQQWREARMDQIDGLLKRQLRPPIAATGMQGNIEDKLQALHAVGGTFVNSSPTGKIDRLMPQMPPDAFTEIHEIDRMFSESGGMPAVLAGQGETGIRGGEQTRTLGQFGSSRVRKRAFIVEDILELAASMLFWLVQSRDDQAYTTQTGKSFLLAHLPEGTKVRVSAHSSTPIYQDVVIAKADRMLKAGAVDLPDYVELLDPPMADVLRVKARAIEQRRQEAQRQRLQLALQIQQMKAGKGKK